MDPSRQREKGCGEEKKKRGGKLTAAQSTGNPEPAHGAKIGRVVGPSQTDPISFFSSFKSIVHNLLFLSYLIGPHTRAPSVSLSMQLTYGTH